jgi:tight adherence protein C
VEQLTIGLLVFMTVFLGALAALRRAPERQAIGLRLQEIQLQRSSREVALSQPFARRVFVPSLTAVTRTIIGVMPPESVDRVRASLIRAGRRRSDPVVWIMRKWLWTGLLGGAAFLLGLQQRWPSGVVLLLSAACAGLAYLWPEFRIRGAVRRRQASIIKELPETLDLLTITVEAGLGLDQALETVAGRRAGPLSDEIRAYLDEVKLGGERSAAIKAIGSRTGVEELVSFGSALVQAMEFGVSIGQVLRVQSDEARTRRRQRIEERAYKAPVKMLFPLIFLILPALFVVVAGPGFIRAYQEFLHPASPSIAPPSGK